jgi:hypothetical protein
MPSNVSIGSVSPNRVMHSCCFSVLAVISFQVNSFSIILSTIHPWQCNQLRIHYENCTCWWWTYCSFVTLYWCYFQGKSWVSRNAVSNTTTTFPHKYIDQPKDSFTCTSDGIPGLQPESVLMMQFDWYSKWSEIWSVWISTMSLQGSLIYTDFRKHIWNKVCLDLCLYSVDLQDKISCFSATKNKLAPGRASHST